MNAAFKNITDKLQISSTKTDTLYDENGIEATQKFTADVNVMMEEINKLVNEFDKAKITDETLLSTIIQYRETCAEITEKIKIIEKKTNIHMVVFNIFKKINSIELIACYVSGLTRRYSRDISEVISGIKNVNISNIIEIAKELRKYETAEFREFMVKISVLKENILRLAGNSIQELNAFVFEEFKEKRYDFGQLKTLIENTAILKSYLVEMPDKKNIEETLEKINKLMEDYDNPNLRYSLEVYGKLSSIGFDNKNASSITKSIINGTAYDIYNEIQEACKKDFKKIVAVLELVTEKRTERNMDILDDTIKMIIKSIRVWIIEALKTKRYDEIIESIKDVQAVFKRIESALNQDTLEILYDEFLKAENLEHLLEGFRETFNTESALFFVHAIYSEKPDLFGEYIERSIKKKGKSAKIRYYVNIIKYLANNSEKIKRDAIEEFINIIIEKIEKSEQKNIYNQLYQIARDVEDDLVFEIYMYFIELMDKQTLEEQVHLKNKTKTGFTNAISVEQLSNGQVSNVAEAMSKILELLKNNANSLTVREYAENVLSESKLKINEKKEFILRIFYNLIKHIEKSRIDPEVLSGIVTAYASCEKISSDQKIGVMEGMASTMSIQKDLDADNKGNVFERIARNISGFENLDLNERKASLEKIFKEIIDDKVVDFISKNGDGLRELNVIVQGFTRGILFSRIDIGEREDILKHIVSMVIEDAKMVPDLKATALQGILSAILKKPNDTINAWAVGDWVVENETGIVEKLIIFKGLAYSIAESDRDGDILGIIEDYVRNITNSKMNFKEKRLILRYMTHAIAHSFKIPLDKKRVIIDRMKNTLLQVFGNDVIGEKYIEYLGVGIITVPLRDVPIEELVELLVIILQDQPEIFYGIGNYVSKANSQEMRMILKEYNSENQSANILTKPSTINKTIKDFKENPEKTMPIAEKLAKKHGINPENSFIKSLFMRYYQNLSKGHQEYLDKLSPREQGLLLIYAAIKVAPRKELREFLVGPTSQIAKLHTQYNENEQKLVKTYVNKIRSESSFKALRYTVAIVLGSLTAMWVFAIAYSVSVAIVASVSILEIAISPVINTIFRLIFTINKHRKHNIRVLKGEEEILLSTNNEQLKDERINKFKSDLEELRVYNTTNKDKLVKLLENLDKSILQSHEAIIALAEIIDSYFEHKKTMQLVQLAVFTEILSAIDSRMLEDISLIMHRNKDHSLSIDKDGLVSRVKQYVNELIVEELVLKLFDLKRKNDFKDYSEEREKRIRTYIRKIINSALGFSKRIDIHDRALAGLEAQIPEIINELPDREFLKLLEYLLEHKYGGKFLAWLYDRTDVLKYDKDGAAYKKIMLVDKIMKLETKTGFISKEKLSEILTFIYSNIKNRVVMEDFRKDVLKSTEDMNLFELIDFLEILTKIEDAEERLSRVIVFELENTSFYRLEEETDFINRQTDPETHSKLINSWFKYFKIYDEYYSEMEEGAPSKYTRHIIELLKTIKMKNRSSQIIAHIMNELLKSDDTERIDLFFLLVTEMPWFFLAKNIRDGYISLSKEYLASLGFEIVGLSEDDLARREIIEKIASFFQWKPLNYALINYIDGVEDYIKLPRAAGRLENDNPDGTEVQKASEFLVEELRNSSKIIGFFDSKVRNFFDLKYSGEIPGSFVLKVLNDILFGYFTDNNDSNTVDQILYKHYKDICIEVILEDRYILDGINFHFNSSLTRDNIRQRINFTKDNKIIVEGGSFGQDEKEMTSLMQLINKRVIEVLEGGVSDDHYLLKMILTKRSTYVQYGEKNNLPENWWDETDLNNTGKDGKYNYSKEKEECSVDFAPDYEAKELRRKAVRSMLFGKRIGKRLTYKMAEKFALEGHSYSSDPSLRIIQEFARIIGSWQILNAIQEKVRELTKGNYDRFVGPAFALGAALISGIALMSTLYWVGIAMIFSGLGIFLMISVPTARIILKLSEEAGVEKHKEFNLKNPKKSLIKNVKNEKVNHGLKRKTMIEYVKALREYKALIGLLDTLFENKFFEDSIFSINDILQEVKKFEMTQDTYFSILNNDELRGTLKDSIDEKIEEIIDEKIKNSLDRQTEVKYAVIFKEIYGEKVLLSTIMFETQNRRAKILLTHRTDKVPEEKFIPLKAVYYLLRILVAQKFSIETDMLRQKEVPGRMSEYGFYKKLARIAGEGAITFENGKAIISGENLDFSSIKTVFQDKITAEPPKINSEDGFRKYIINQAKILNRSIGKNPIVEEKINLIDLVKKLFPMHLIADVKNYHEGDSTVLTLVEASVGKEKLQNLKNLKYLKLIKTKSVNINSSELSEAIEKLQGAKGVPKPIESGMVGEYKWYLFDETSPFSEKEVAISKKGYFEAMRLLTKAVEKQGFSWKEDSIQMVLANGFPKPFGWSYFEKKQPIQTIPKLKWYKAVEEAIASNAKIVIAEDGALKEYSKAVTENILKTLQKYPFMSIKEAFIIERSNYRKYLYDQKMLDEKSDKLTMFSTYRAYAEKHPELGLPKNWWLDAKYAAHTDECRIDFAPEHEADISMADYTAFLMSHYYGKVSDLVYDSVKATVFPLLFTVQFTDASYPKTISGIIQYIIGMRFTANPFLKSLVTRITGVISMIEGEKKARADAIAKGKTEKEIEEAARQGNITAHRKHNIAHSEAPLSIEGKNSEQGKDNLAKVMKHILAKLRLVATQDSPFHERIRTTALNNQMNDFIKAILSKIKVNRDEESDKLHKKNKKALRKEWKKLLKDYGELINVVFTDASDIDLTTNEIELMVENPDGFIGVWDSLYRKKILADSGYEPPSKEEVEEGRELIAKTIAENEKISKFLAELDDKIKLVEIPNDREDWLMKFRVLFVKEIKEILEEGLNLTFVISSLNPKIISFCRESRITVKEEVMKNYGVNEVSEVLNELIADVFYESPSEEHVLKWTNGVIELSEGQEKINQFIIGLENKLKLLEIPNPEDRKAWLMSFRHKCVSALQGTDNWSPEDILALIVSSINTYSIESRAKISEEIKGRYGVKNASEFIIEQIGVLLQNLNYIFPSVSTIDKNFKFVKAVDGIEKGMPGFIFVTVSFNGEEKIFVYPSNKKASDLLRLETIVFDVFKGGFPVIAENVYLDEIGDLKGVLIMGSVDDFVKSEKLARKFLAKGGFSKGETDQIIDFDSIRKKIIAFRSLIERALGEPNEKEVGLIFATFSEMTYQNEQKLNKFINALEVQGVSRNVLVEIKVLITMLKNSNMSEDGILEILMSELVYDPQIRNRIALALAAASNEIPTEEQIDYIFEAFSNMTPGSELEERYNQYSQIFIKKGIVNTPQDKDKLLMLFLENRGKSEAEMLEILIPAFTPEPAEPESTESPADSRDLITSALRNLSVEPTEEKINKIFEAFSNMTPEIQRIFENCENGLKKQGIEITPTVEIELLVKILSYLGENPEITEDQVIIEIISSYTNEYSDGVSNPLVTKSSFEKAKSIIIGAKDKKEQSKAVKKAEKLAKKYGLELTQAMDKKTRKQRTMELVAIYAALVVAPYSDEENNEMLNNTQGFIREHTQEVRDKPMGTSENALKSGLMKVFDTWKFMQSINLAVNRILSESMGKKRRLRTTKKGHFKHNLETIRNNWELVRGNIRSGIYPFAGLSVLTTNFKLPKRIIDLHEHLISKVKEYYSYKGDKDKTDSLVVFQINKIFGALVQKKITTESILNELEKIKGIFESSLIAEDEEMTNELIILFYSICSNGNFWKESWEEDAAKQAGVFVGRHQGDEYDEVQKMPEDFQNVLKNKLKERSKQSVFGPDFEKAEDAITGKEGEKPGLEAVKEHLRRVFPKMLILDWLGTVNFDKELSSEMKKVLREYLERGTHILIVSATHQSLDDDLILEFRDQIHYGLPLMDKKKTAEYTVEGLRKRGVLKHNSEILIAGDQPEDLFFLNVVKNSLSIYLGRVSPEYMRFAGVLGEPLVSESKGPDGLLEILKFALDEQKKREKTPSTFGHKTAKLVARYALANPFSDVGKLILWAIDRNDFKGLNERSLIGLIANQSAVLAESIISMFKEGSEVLEYKNSKIIKTEVARKLRANKLKIKKGSVVVNLTDNPALVNPDAYAFAAMEIGDEGDDVNIYLHKELMDFISDRSPPDRKRLLKLVAQHEVDEYLALNEESSPAYRTFTEFLIQENLARTSESFHKYIKSLKEKETLMGIEHELVKQNEMLEIASLLSSGIDIENRIHYGDLCDNLELLLAERIGLRATSHVPMLADMVRLGILDEIKSRIKDIIENSSSGSPYNIEFPQNIYISWSGPVDPETGAVWGVHIPGFVNFNLKAYLENWIKDTYKFNPNNKVNVEVVNDGVAAASGEYFHRYKKRLKPFVFIKELAKRIKSDVGHGFRRNKRGSYRLVRVDGIGFYPSLKEGQSYLADVLSARGVARGFVEFVVKERKNVEQYFGEKIVLSKLIDENRELIQTVIVALNEKAVSGDLLALEYLKNCAAEIGRVVYALNNILEKKNAFVTLTLATGISVGVGKLETKGGPNRFTLVGRVGGVLGTYVDGKNLREISIEGKSFIELVREYAGIERVYRSSINNLGDFLAFKPPEEGSYDIVFNMGGRAIRSAKVKATDKPWDPDQALVDITEKQWLYGYGDVERKLIKTSSMEKTRVEISDDQNIPEDERRYAMSGLQINPKRGNVILSVYRPLMDIIKTMEPLRQKNILRLLVNYKLAEYNAVKKGLTQKDFYEQNLSKYKELFNLIDIVQKTVKSKKITMQTDVEPLTITAEVKLRRKAKELSYTFYSSEQALLEIRKKKRLGSLVSDALRRGQQVYAQQVSFKPTFICVIGKKAQGLGNAALEFEEAVKEIIYQPPPKWSKAIKNDMVVDVSDLSKIKVYKESEGKKRTLRKEKVLAEGLQKRIRQKIEDRIKSLSREASLNNTTISSLRSDDFFRDKIDMNTPYPVVAGSGVQYGKKVVVTGKIEPQEARNLIKELKEHAKGLLEKTGNILIEFREKIDFKEKAVYMEAKIQAENQTQENQDRILTFIEGFKYEYAISDTHLASKGGEDKFGPEQEKVLIADLDLLIKIRGTLVINGDFLDLWQAKYKKIKNAYPKLFEKLKQVRRIIYIAGNHDESVLPDWAHKKHSRTNVHKLLQADFPNMEIVPFYLDIRGRFIEHSHQADSLNYQSKVGKSFTYISKWFEKIASFFGFKTFQQRFMGVYHGIQFFLFPKQKIINKKYFERAYGLANMLRWYDGRMNLLHYVLQIIFGHTHKPHVLNTGYINYFLLASVGAVYGNTGTWTHRASLDYKVLTENIKKLLSPIRRNDPQVFIKELKRLSIKLKNILQRKKLSAPESSSPAPLILTDFYKYAVHTDLYSRMGREHKKSYNIVTSKHRKETARAILDDGSLKDKPKKDLNFKAKIRNWIRGLRTKISRSKKSSKQFSDEKNGEKPAAVGLREPRTVKKAQDIFFGLNENVSREQARDEALKIATKYGIRTAFLNSISNNVRKMETIGDEYLVDIYAALKLAPYDEAFKFAFKPKEFVNAHTQYTAKERSILFETVRGIRGVSYKIAAFFSIVSGILLGVIFWFTIPIFALSVALDLAVSTAVFVISFYLRAVHGHKMHEIKVLLESEHFFNLDYLAYVSGEIEAVGKEIEYGTLKSMTEAVLNDDGSAFKNLYEELEDNSWVLDVFVRTILNFSRFDILEKKQKAALVIGTIIESKNVFKKRDINREIKPIVQMIIDITALEHEEKAYILADAVWKASEGIIRRADGGINNLRVALNLILKQIHNTDRFSIKEKAFLIRATENKLIKNILLSNRVDALKLAKGVLNIFLDNTDQNAFLSGSESFGTIIDEISTEFIERIIEHDSQNAAAIIKDTVMDLYNRYYKRLSNYLDSARAIILGKLSGAAIVKIRSSRPRGSYSFEDDILGTYIQSDKLTVGQMALISSQIAGTIVKGIFLASDSKHLNEDIKTVMMDISYLVYSIENERLTQTNKAFISGKISGSILENVYKNERLNALAYIRGIMGRVSFRFSKTEVLSAESKAMLLSQIASSITEVIIKEEADSDTVIFYIKEMLINASFGICGVNGRNLSIEDKANILNQIIFKVNQTVAERSPDNYSSKNISEIVQEISFGICATRPLANTERLDLLRRILHVQMAENHGEWVIQGLFRGISLVKKLDLESKKFILSGLIENIIIEADNYDNVYAGCIIKNCAYGLLNCITSMEIKKEMLKELTVLVLKSSFDRGKKRVMLENISHAVGHAKSLTIDKRIEALEEIIRIGDSKTFFLETPYFGFGTADSRVVFLEALHDGLYTVPHSEKRGEPHSHEITYENWAKMTNLVLMKLEESGAEIKVSVLSHKVLELIRRLMGVEKIADIASVAANMLIGYFKQKLLGLEEEQKYQKKINMIQTAAVNYIKIVDPKNKNEIEVKISDNEKLLSRDGSALATMVVMGNGKFIIYVHKALLDEIGESEELKQKVLLENVGKHEILEYFALNKKKSEIYKLFDKYLQEGEEDNERNSENFHKYLKTKPKISSFNISHGAQNELMMYAKWLWLKRDIEKIQRMKIIPPDAGYMSDKSEFKKGLNRILSGGRILSKGMSFISSEKLAEVLTGMNSNNIELIHRLGYINENDKNIVISKNVKKLEDLSSEFEDNIKKLLIGHAKISDRKGWEFIPAVLVSFLVERYGVPLDVIKQRFNAINWTKSIVGFMQKYPEVLAFAVKYRAPIEKAWSAQVDYKLKEKLDSQNLEVSIFRKKYKLTDRQAWEAWENPELKKKIIDEYEKKKQQQQQKKKKNTLLVFPSSYKIFRNNSNFFNRLRKKPAPEEKWWKHLIEYQLTDDGIEDKSIEPFNLLNKSNYGKKYRKYIRENIFNILDVYKKDRENGDRESYHSLGWGDISFWSLIENIDKDLLESEDVVSLISQVVSRKVLENTGGLSSQRQCLYAVLKILHSPAEKPISQVRKMSYFEKQFSSLKIGHHGMSDQLKKYENNDKNREIIDNLIRKAIKDEKKLRLLEKIQKFIVPIFGFWENIIIAFAPWLFPKLHKQYNDEQQKEIAKWAWGAFAAGWTSAVVTAIAVWVNVGLAWLSFGLGALALYAGISVAHFIKNNFFGIPMSMDDDKKDELLDAPKKGQQYNLKKTGADNLTALPAISTIDELINFITGGKESKNGWLTSLITNRINPLISLMSKIGLIPFQEEKMFWAASQNKMSGSSTNAAIKDIMDAHDNRKELRDGIKLVVLSGQIAFEWAQSKKNIPFPINAIAVLSPQIASFAK
ncbi:metallophosphoesterase, partial [Elusimicrobiota bacterium]